MAQYFWTAEDYDVGDDAGDAWGNPIAVINREIAEDTDGKHLNFRGSNFTRSFLSFLPPGLDAPRDVEVWIKYVATDSNQDAAPAFARGQYLDNDATMNLVRADWNRTSGRITRFLNGAWGSLGSHSGVFPAGTLGCSRSSFIGDNFKSKWWEDSAGEPSVWDLELQNDDFDHGGTIGTFGWSSHFLKIYAFGVGTDGDPAPSEPVTPSGETKESVGLSWGIAASSGEATHETAAVSTTSGSTHSSVLNGGVFNGWALNGGSSGLWASAKVMAGASTSAVATTTRLGSGKAVAAAISGSTSVAYSLAYGEGVTSAVGTSTGESVRTAFGRHTAKATSDSYAISYAVKNPKGMLLQAESWVDMTPIGYGIAYGEGLPQATAKSEASAYRVRLGVGDMSASASTEIESLRTVGGLRFIAEAHSTSSSFTSTNYWNTGSAVSTAASTADSVIYRGVYAVLNPADSMAATSSVSGKWRQAQLSNATATAVAEATKTTRTIRMSGLEVSGRAAALLPMLRINADRPAPPRRQIVLPFMDRSVSLGASSRVIYLANRNGQ